MMQRIKKLFSGRGFGEASSGISFVDNILLDHILSISIALKDSLLLKLTVGNMGSWRGSSMMTIGLDIWKNLG